MISMCMFLSTAKRICKTVDEERLKRYYRGYGHLSSKNIMCASILWVFMNSDPDASSIGLKELAELYGTTIHTICKYTKIIIKGEKL